MNFSSDDSLDEENSTLASDSVSTEGKFTLFENEEAKIPWSTEGNSTKSNKESSNEEETEFWNEEPIESEFLSSKIHVFSDTHTIVVLLALFTIAKNYTRMKKKFIKDMLRYTQLILSISNTFPKTYKEFQQVIEFLPIN